MGTRGTRERRKKNREPTFLGNGSFFSFCLFTFALTAGTHVAMSILPFNSLDLARKSSHVHALRVNIHQKSLQNIPPLVHLMHFGSILQSVRNLAKGLCSQRYLIIVRVWNEISSESLRSKKLPYETSGGKALKGTPHVAFVLYVPSLDLRASFNTHRVSG